MRIVSSMNTQDKGDLAELRVASALKRSGYTVLLPFTENEQYDLVAEQDGEFARIQVKHGSYDEQKLVVRCCNRKFYTEDSIDGIAAYSSEMNECFWIPYRDMNKYKITLSEDGKHTFDEYRL